ncbi:hemolysin III family protein [Flammeovirgaceae bacterium SG7u.111]|nr:hemolysin III family protein [Flammeovirgaceae bacterium SG7u.132]WPO33971.1 hemolysin III family protein [Flammeovirgaceae bacterium SG7u.111]
MPINLELKSELANAITHGIGIVLGIVGIPLLLTLAAQNGETYVIIAAAIYGFSYMMVYSSSTIYHAVTHVELKKELRKLDHISIFFLIAGTYSPFVMIFGLDDSAGKILLAAQWVFTFLGIIFKLFFTNRFKYVSTGIYLLMGWSIVLVPNSFLFKMPSETLWLVSIGGGFYTIGVLFYLWKSLRFHHAIWHIFVLFGSLSHFAALMTAIT